MNEVNSAAAILYGRDHVDIGRIGAVAQGRVAIALSRGGAHKTYHHKDPNEDAAAYAVGPGGVVLVIADAHGGRGAAEVAVDHVAGVCAPAWTGSAPPAGDWPDLVRRTIDDVHMEILQSVARGGIATSRSTLAFALIRPEQDAISIASIGDSHAFRVGADGIDDLASAPGIAPAFLGGPADTIESLAPHCVAAVASLTQTRAVMLLTDGLSERGIGVADPAVAVAAAVELAARETAPLRPIAAARSAVEAALAAHFDNRAGDNVACAAAWLED